MQGCFYCTPWGGDVLRDDVLLRRERQQTPHASAAPAGTVGLNTGRSRFYLAAPTGVLLYSFHSFIVFEL